MSRLVPILTVLALVMVACGGDDVDEGAYCTAVLDLVADPLDVELARAAAAGAPDDQRQRLFAWQAELAGLVLDPDYEPGTLPDWEELGFDREPTVDDIATQLADAAAGCAGVSSA